MKITEGIKIVLSYGSCFDYMIDLSKELLKEGIYSDYKQVLVLLQSERPALAYQLTVEVIACKLYWWPIGSYLRDLTLAQMWERYYKENFGLEEEDKFMFSNDEWVLEDNSQQLTSIKRNKKDDHDNPKKNIKEIFFLKQLKQWKQR